LVAPKNELNILKVIGSHKNLIMALSEVNILNVQLEAMQALCANINIIFNIPRVMSFPKICYFTHHHKFWTKIFL